MKKILNVQNWTLLAFCIVMTLVAVSNSFTFVGLIEDGAYRFFEALTCENFILGMSGSETIPYNVRYFPSILAHASVGFSAQYLGILNIKYLLYIFTFMSYFKWIICLIIIYLNLPKDKKEIFEIILLSFLITFTFTSYQIWAENIMTGLFIWIPFVIFYYVDFDKLTVFNKFCIVIFSFVLISSHQMVLVFIPGLLIIAIKKNISARNLNISSRIALEISYIFLVFAIIFNILSMFGGLSDNYTGQTQKYMSITLLLENTAFVLFCSGTMIILLLSFFKNNTKYDKVKYFITVIFAFYIFHLFLFQIPTHSNFSNVTLGFHIPLFFFILMIFIGLFKIKIEYKYIKLINLALCLLICLNSIHYGLFWKRYLTNINEYILKNENITITFSDKRIWKYPTVMGIGADVANNLIQYRTCHPKYILYILIFMPHLFDKYKFNNFISLKTPKDYRCNSTKHTTTYFVIQRKETLKQFGMDVDSYVRVNKKYLLQ
ncbi:MAG: hypothetical protein PHR82_10345 [Endomicrobiaceae bacterium]|nr:hypothetical protein [Endomicrobiaceae bacterium]